MPRADNERPRAEPMSTMPFAAWTRPRGPGNDPSMAGPGTPPPGRTFAEIIEFRMVTGSALELLNDATSMLNDAMSAQPGALVQVTAALDTIRLAADRLETLTQPANKHVD